MTETPMHPDQVLYEKVASAGCRNVIFSALGLGVVWLLARVWLLGAKILFWIEAVLVAFDVLQTVLVTAAGLALMFSERQDSKWVWGANGVRVVQAIICMLADWFAAGIVGYAKAGVP